MIRHWPRCALSAAVNHSSSRIPLPAAQKQSRKQFEPAALLRAPIVPKRKSRVNGLDHSTALAANLNVVDVLWWRFGMKVSVLAA